MRTPWSLHHRRSCASLLKLNTLQPTGEVCVSLVEYFPIARPNGSGTHLLATQGDLVRLCKSTCWFLGVQRYAFLTIRYVSRYGHHDLIRISIHISSAIFVNFVTYSQMSNPIDREWRFASRMVWESHKGPKVFTMSAGPMHSFSATVASSKFRGRPRWDKASKNT